ncbi:MAG: DUF2510 domain-containing protein [Microbacteriaceae bacterium]
MTTPHNSGTPAGWYPDPSGTGGQRWWNGVDWTNDVQTAYVEAHLRQPIPAAAAGTPAYNVNIWIVLGLLLVSTLSLFTLNVETQIQAAIREGSTGVTAPSDPWLIANQLLSYVLYALSVLFAYFDWRAIKRSGVVKPFHWAWSFLSILVYLIGRGVVMKRRVGAGIATLWIAIGYFVIVFIYTVGIIVVTVGLIINDANFAP